MFKRLRTREVKITNILSVRKKVATAFLQIKLRKQRIAA